MNLLRKIAEAGKLRRALFVCDRDELRQQAITAFQGVFGADAAVVVAGNPQKNARVLIATYQTLDVASDEASANFLTDNYPPDYFSHIIIDECHRSAWGKWSIVLSRNGKAAQIGLTATPRRIEGVAVETKQGQADLKIAADNYTHFGEPVYEYDMSQGIEDGYLAACEIHQFDLFHDNKDVSEREAGVAKEDLLGKRLTDARTGAVVSADEAADWYSASALEDRLISPERVAAMAKDLFQHLIDSGGPEQKTIIFCARDRHADDVATVMNNLYVEWCNAQGRQRMDPYAFKCTAESEGGDFLADFRGSQRRFFVATTVELLTTGVDVPAVENIVFFKYVLSPIAFYQMVGRGTRIHNPTGKLMFRVYDYTDATRLFGEEFKGKVAPPRKPGPKGPDGPEPPQTIQVEGIEVVVTQAGHSILTQVDGHAMPVPIEEYRQRLAARLLEEAPSLDAFRKLWVVPPERLKMLGNLPDAGRSPLIVQQVTGKKDFDLFDVLGDLAYGLLPLSRADRADAFAYKHEAWLASLPKEAAAALRALVSQFAKGGTESLENPEVLDTPEVRLAGGLAALKFLGKPAEVLLDAKRRMFAA